jgi:hypothetical protein
MASQVFPRGVSSISSKTFSSLATCVRHWTSLLLSWLCGETAKQNVGSNRWALGLRCCRRSDWSVCNDPVHSASLGLEELLYPRQPTPTQALWLVDKSQERAGPTQNSLHEPPVAVGCPLP